MTKLVSCTFCIILAPACWILGVTVQELSSWPQSMVKEVLKGVRPTTGSIATGMTMFEGNFVAFLGRETT